jgi:catechol 2,3-dioxygenase-like lactoylglutathione lyase family enzyme
MMRSRLLYAAVVVTAMLSIVGFVVLVLGANVTDDDVRAYRWTQGLPARVGPDRWALSAVGYAVGAALSLLVVVLAARWWNTGRNRAALSLALLAGIAVGLALALDGLLNLRPTGALAGVVPAWYSPLSTAQGLLMVGVFGLAALTLPSPGAGPTFGGAGPRVRVGSVVLKVGDLDRAARFWTAALGYTRSGDPGGSAFLLPADGDGPQLTLDADDATHLDLFVADETAQRAEIERLVALGARRVDWPDVPHVVLADPEGNLFCVVVDA